jgi:hypothetical protein
VSFCGEEWSIFGRMREARDDACELADEVCSVRMVVLRAIHAYSSGVEEDEDAIVFIQAELMGSELRRKFMVWMRRSSNDPDSSRGPTSWEPLVAF